MQVCSGLLLNPHHLPHAIAVALCSCCKVQQCCSSWAWLPACSRAQPLPALLPAVYDVYHRCKDLGTAINTTVSYQYVTLNAPFDIFNSYLDVRPCCCHSTETC